VTLTHLTGPSAQAPSPPLPHPYGNLDPPAHFASCFAAYLPRHPWRGVRDDIVTFRQEAEISSLTQSRRKCSRPHPRLRCPRVASQSCFANGPARTADTPLSLLRCGPAGTSVYRRSPACDSPCPGARHSAAHPCGNPNPPPRRPCYLVGTAAEPLRGVHLSPSSSPHYSP
jgi:hypothetical protein